MKISHRKLHKVNQTSAVEARQRTLFYHHSRKDKRIRSDAQIIQSLYRPGKNHNPRGVI